MSTNSKNKTETLQETEAIVAHARAIARGRKITRAKELASQIKPQFDGSILIQRFSLKERIQHFVLIFSFTTLGFTGLIQTFSAWSPIAWLINVVLGGVDTVRVIHHLAAIVFILQAILHGFDILYFWFVKREMGSMIPAWSDLTGLIGMLKYNLGFIKARPQFDRFSVEEKVEYWALWWGALTMGITGVFQWFPALVTQLLPGIVVPMARLIHMLEAILAVLAIAIWHSYHTMIKERNLSIFTGHMTEHEMEENHPLEYQRILKAYEYIKNLKAKPVAVPQISKTEPEAPTLLVKEIEISVDESTDLPKENNMQIVESPIVQYEQPVTHLEETVE